MLLLGIETSTRRVGVVLASEDGMLARVELGGHADDGPPAPRRTARARDRVLLRADRHHARPRVGDRGRDRPGHVHRAARRRDDGEGARAGAARADDPGAEPRPARVPVAPHARRLSSPRSTRAATSSTTRCTGRCRVACSARRSTRSAAPDDLVAELEARGEEALLCGDGALRFAPVLGDVEHVELAGPAHAAPSLAALAELAIARLRARGVLQRRRRAALVPAQERRRARAGTERTADVATARKLDRAARGAHRADAPPAPARGAAHRGAGVPHAVDARAVRQRARAALDARRTWSRSVGREVIGYAGLMMSLERRSRHHDRGRPRMAAPGHRHAAAGRARARGDRARRDRAHARGAALAPRRAAAVPAFRVHVGRRAQGLLRRHRRGRARSCGRTTSINPTYAALLERLEHARARHDRVRTTEELVTVRILGIETSCDETAAAVVDDGRDVRSSVVSSQVDLHARYGGVVPEIASRAHVELVNDVIDAGAARSRRHARATSTRSPRCTVPGSRARCSWA